MSYDVLLSQLAEEKLTTVFKQQHEEEKKKKDTDSDKTLKPSGSSDNSTPSRKISTSRLMNALSQFYGNNDDNDHSNGGSGSGPSSSSGRTPTRAMETKLMSMWHNVKYGWNGKIRSNFSKEQPVWLLGRCYHRKFTPPSSMETSAELTSNLENKVYLNEPQFQLDESLVIQEFGQDAIEGQNAENPWEEGIEGFKRDFYSRLWMTYRREFPTMNGSNYTSDCGWGCMLRSGQMLLSQALLCHFLGRSWRWDSETQLHSTYEDNMHRKIIKWFGDSSSKNSPFSIHTLVNLGQEMGKKAGDWYGPSSVSHLLRQAVQKAAQENADLDDINVYVAKNCTVYIQDILDECLVPEPPVGGFTAPWQHLRKKSIETIGQIQMHWKALVILVPLRLGAEKLNGTYANILKTLLSTEYCIGIIGGRPKHSLYFIGYQEDKLIHLDPHYCQEMVDVNQENFPVNSFHCKSPRKLKLSKMDPSCCIGFYCQTKIDFDNFITSVKMYLHPIRTSDKSQQQTATTTTTGSSPSSQDGVYPMFAFSRGRNIDHNTDDVPESVYKPLRQQLANMNQQQQQQQQQTTPTNCNNDDDDEDDETEEFVIL